MIKRYKKYFNSNLGFSLAELMVSAGIMVIITAGILTAFSAGSTTWKLNQFKIELTQDLRTSVEWMKDDIQQSTSSSIQDVPANGTWYTTVTFRIPESIDSRGVITWPDETVQYLRGGSDGNQLLRQREEAAVIQETRVVSDNISEIKFRRLAATPNNMDVSITVSKSYAQTPVTITTVFEENLRN